MKKSNLERLSTLTLIVISLRIIVTMTFILIGTYYIFLTPNILDNIKQFISEMMKFVTSFN